MQLEVGPDLEPVVVELLECELLVDTDSPILSLQTDGFCLDCVLTVWSQLKLDADIAGRDILQDNILEQWNIIGNYNYQYLIVKQRKYNVHFILYKL